MRLFRPSVSLARAASELERGPLRIVELWARHGLSDEAIGDLLGVRPAVIHHIRMEALAGLPLPEGPESERRRRVAEALEESIVAWRHGTSPAPPGDLGRRKVVRLPVRGVPAPLRLVPRGAPGAAPARVPEPAPVRPAPLPAPAPRPVREPGRRVAAGILTAILAVGGLLRSWQIMAVGLNSDEAVYAGQGASIAGVDELAPYFPTFRAHPLLFQTLVSVGFKLDIPELFGRLSAGVLGVATVWVVYSTGKLLYGRRAGLIAAALVALMPYHVVVSRQILLDGPMVFASTSTLYLLARYARTGGREWLYAAAGAMGLTFLCKEGSVILLGSVYAFLALTPRLRTGLHHLVGASILFVVVISAFPLALKLAGHTKTGGNFLAWQLFRRPNHDWLFYPTVVPVAMGLLVVAAAALGLWLLRSDGSWRETLLLSWISVPVGFFQMFPVKGFQYLLPIAPAVAILAARFLARWDPHTLVVPNVAARMPRPWLRRAALRLEVLRSPRTMPIALAIVLLSLLIPSWSKVQPSKAATFLAGSGGVPGGKEAGEWVARNVPVGARMMSVGPSMANILQYYGHRKVYGLSVSPNPLHRNPVYEPMKNPDRLIRDNELQYVVWDAFSADRTPFFSRKVTRYAERYNGHVAHTETVPVRTAAGRTVRKPVIIIYEVSP